MNNLNFLEENLEDFSLNKKIIDLIDIKLFQNNKNKYILNINRLKQKTNKISNEFIPFGLLDIDTKTHIKYEQTFDYSELNNKFLIEVNFFFNFL